MRRWGREDEGGGVVARVGGTEEQRTEMECGSGQEAHRCIGSGFSWGSWLRGGGWGEGAKLAREGGLLPWLRARQGHSRLALGVLGMVGG